MPRLSHGLACWTSRFIDVSWHYLESSPTNFLPPSRLVSSFLPASPPRRLRYPSPASYILCFQFSLASALSSPSSLSSQLWMLVDFCDFNSSTLFRLETRCGFATSSSTARYPRSSSSALLLAFSLAVSLRRTTSASTLKHSILHLCFY